MKTYPINMFMTVSKEDLSGLNLSPNMFSISRKIQIEYLQANQKEIEKDCLSRKLKGVNLSIPIVLIYKGKYILMDGHHTVIAKMLKGFDFIRCKTLIID